MTARHERKKAHQLCRRCREREALFGYRGQVRADRDHPPSVSDLRQARTLCFECYRSERECQRAQAPSTIEPPLLSSPLHARSTLSDGEIAHRRAMLEHLARAKTRGAN